MIRCERCILGVIFNFYLISDLEKRCQNAIRKLPVHFSQVQDLHFFSFPVQMRIGDSLHFLLNT